MIFHGFKTQFHFGMVLLASGIALGTAAPGGAQTGYSAPVYQEDPGTALSRHLRTLAESPRDLGALTGAAKAALELGDAQAAATFYARAEEVAPRDGRVKAGLGSAFLAMEQVEPALKFFEDARALGVPEGELAADRGLAYDLIGNPAQAQRDYALAMRGNDNDEVRRRMALSKAISGDRAGALAVIDAQLRRQDRAAWRVRALVLALTGDAAGATEAVRTVMPSQAAAMQPFLARLPSLRPADRAMAVHFGHFPGDGSIRMADASPQSYASFGNPVPQTANPPAASAPFSSALPQRRIPATEPLSTASRRRPGRGESGPTYAEERDLLRGGSTTRRRGVVQPAQAAAEPIRSRQPARDGLAQSSDAQARASVVERPEQMPVRPPADPAATQLVEVSSAIVRPLLSPVQGPPAGASLPSPRVDTDAGAASVVGSATLPASTIVPPSPVGDEASAVVAPAASAAAASPGLADIAAAIRALPSEEEAKPNTVRPVKPSPKGTIKADPKKTELAKKTETARKDEAADKAKSRYWVQLASASDALALNEYKRLKAKAPKLLSGTTGWKASFRSTNRVLVGPFKDQKEAQALVNALAKANIDAVPWMSAEGQEIVKLAAK